MSVDVAIDGAEAAPSQRLGQYRAWGLAGRARARADLVWISVTDAAKPAAHRVLPHGEPSIAIRRRHDRQGDISACDLIICGPFRRALWYRPEPAEELIAVRLKPETAGEIFGVAPADYADAQVARAPAKIQYACAAALAAAQSAARIDDIARRLIEGVHKLADDTLHKETPENTAAEWLRACDGAMRAGDLAQSLDVSERHLRRRFAERFGCSLKTYSRQLRLTAATLRSEREERPFWAALAADCGFHDQAHMINEFQALTGMTPQQIHTERRALSGFSNTQCE